MLYPLDFNLVLYIGPHKVDLKPTENTFVSTSFLTPIAEYCIPLTANQEQAEAYCLPVLIRDSLPIKAILKIVEAAILCIVQRKGRMDKPLLVFTLRDDEGPYFHIPNVYFFRTSMNRQKRLQNEFSSPYFWGMSTTQKPYPPIDQPQTLPSVGFCGYVNTSERKKLLQRLERKNPFFKSTFICRESFFGRIEREKSIQQKEKMRFQFKRNMATNIFNVCCRGRGNFSMRFYETMSCGRIPVLINSHMVLPFEDKIDYDDVLIQGKDEHEVYKKLLHWIAHRDLVEQQKKSRMVWEEYLSREGFQKQLSLLLSELRIES